MEPYAGYVAEAAAEHRNMSVEIVQAIDRSQTSPFDAAASCSVCDAPFQVQLQVGNEQGIAVVRLCHRHRLEVRRVLGDWTVLPSKTSTT